MRRSRKVKILATIGPASSSEDMLRKLFEAGADVFRINMSHTDHELMRTLVTRIRSVEKAVGRPIGILADLQALARDSEELLKATAGDVSEKTKEVRARLATALERSKSTMAELQSQAIAGAKAAARKADTVIREHPYESLGVAFGVGLVIGVLVGRR